MIIFYSGNAGSGKTWQALHGEEDILFFDLEMRGKDILPYFPDLMVDHRDILQINKTTYKKDYYKSYMEFEKQVQEFILSTELPSTVIVDGVSDLRNKYAKAKWSHDNPKRKQPMPEDYREINPLAENLIEPLMNKSTVCGFDLICTSQLEDVNTVSTKNDDRNRTVKSSIREGERPQLKKYQSHGATVLVTLSASKKKYYAEVTKSQIGIDEFEITKLSLYEELVKRGL